VLEPKGKWKRESDSMWFHRTS